MPSFDEMYNRLRFLMDRNIPIHVVSTSNTTYSIEARQLQSGNNAGELAIVCTIVVTENGIQPEGQPPKIYIHRDCWGSEITCGKTRAGGVYNGTPSIYNWFSNNL
jgi:hypothetical protein